MKNLSNDVLRAYLKSVASINESLYKPCFHDAEQLQALMSEYGIDYVDHSCCDGFCPECVSMHNCEAYEEIQGEWEGFYS